MKTRFSYLYFSLIFVQFWCTVSYYGIQTILVLYLLHQSYTLDRAYAIYGCYVAALYILPTLAGFVVDKWIGVGYGFLFGITLAIFGNFFLISGNHFYFAFGISLLVIGAGFAKSCSLSFTGILNNNTALKEKAYNLIYVIGNIAGTLGPILYALIIWAWGWNKIFLLNGLCLSCSIIPFIYLLQKYLLQNPPIHLKVTNAKYACMIIFCIFLFAFLTFYSNSFGPYLISTLFLASLLYLLVIYRREPIENKKQLALLVLLSFYGMFYYLGSMQVASTITIFIQDKINQGQIHFPFPASMFNSLYTIFIVVFSPFMASLWRYIHRNIFAINIFHKLAIGIIFGGLGLVLFAFASALPFILLFVVLGIACLSLGELMLAPAIYTIISDVAPQHLKTTMMGCWLLFVALGGYLSSSYVRFILHFKLQSDFLLFMSMGLIIILSALTLILISSKLKKHLA